MSAEDCMVEGSRLHPRLVLLRMFCRRATGSGSHQHQHTGGHPRVESMTIPWYEKADMQVLNIGAAAPSTLRRINHETCY